ncbi:hypothetical protein [Escherichia coli]|uniref:hypothetical protein n=1 Tax=Escherichia coli TaxID=562 RepID=UPI000B0DD13E|nr:hypothetical protein [Escherichia coli]GDN80717.1 hypothetical protein BvCmsNSNP043_04189 [Escherichia coli]
MKAEIKSMQKITENERDVLSELYEGQKKAEENQNIIRNCIFLLSEAILVLMIILITVFKGFNAVFIMVSLTAGSALILMFIYNYIDDIFPGKIFLSSEDVMELGLYIKNNDTAKLLLSEKIISGCLLTVRDADVLKNIVDKDLIAKQEKERKKHYEDVMADILKPGKEYDTRK